MENINEMIIETDEEPEIPLDENLEQANDQYRENGDRSESPISSITSTLSDFEEENDDPASVLDSELEDVNKGVSKLSLKSNEKVEQSQSEVKSCTLPDDPKDKKNLKDPKNEPSKDETGQPKPQIQGEASSNEPPKEKKGQENQEDKSDDESINADDLQRILQLVWENNFPGQELYEALGITEEEFEFLFREIN